MEIILYGKPVAEELDKNSKKVFDVFKSSNKRKPKLTAITVGEDPASLLYVSRKEEKANEIGVEFNWIKLPEKTSQNDLDSHIKEVTEESDGIILQLPLPGHINSQNIINAINPEKDVDGFHPENAGWLAIGKPRFIPCTPKGIMRILDDYDIDLSGKNIVVIGRSNIVGRPISILTSLNVKGANGTCTICHSRTKNLEHYTMNADVVITAIGIPNYLTGDMIKDEAVVIDVGINRVDADNDKGYQIVGDADWNSVIDKVSAITPVPGGVGPMTIAMLVENTIEAAENFG